MANRILFLDMDGTLIHGDYSGAFLCRLNGVSAHAIRQTELPEARGEINWMEGDLLRAPMMAGLPVARVEADIGALPIIGDLPDFIRAVKAMGFAVVLASAGPGVAARALAERFGFDHWFASDYHIENGSLTGRVAHFITAQEKADRVLALCESLGARPEDCVAVGDGASDLLMFAAVGHAIALNGQPAARKAADHSVSAASILALLPLIEAFVGQTNEN